MPVFLCPRCGFRPHGGEAAGSPESCPRCLERYRLPVPLEPQSGQLAAAWRRGLGRTTSKPF